jgi:hypothetical protein
MGPFFSLNILKTLTVFDFSGYYFSRIPTFLSRNSIFAEKFYLEVELIGWPNEVYQCVNYNTKIYDFLIVKDYYVVLMDLF